MLPIYYIAFVAQTEVAAQLESSGRDTVSVNRFQPFASIVNWATQAYATVVQSIENARIEFQNWSDSQHACAPARAMLADCWR